MAMIDEFEALKDGRILWFQVTEFTEEMKWWLLRNDKLLFAEEFGNLNEDMIKYLIENGKAPFYSHYRKPETELKEIAKNIHKINISEDTWIKGIRNAVIGIFDMDFLLMVKDCCDLNEDIAIELCKKTILMFTDEKVKSAVPQNRKAEITQAYLDKKLNGINQSCSLLEDLPLNEEQWKLLVENNFFHDEETYLNRDDVPIFAMQHYLKNDEYLRELKKPLSKENLIYWFTIHKDNLGNYDCQDAIKYRISCDEMPEVITQCPFAFKYLNKKPAKVAEAAIKADVSNIQYIKKPSDKLRVLAVTIDKDAVKYLDTVTSAVAKALGISEKEIEEVTKPKYTAPYYLVKFNEDLADEGFLHFHTIIPGNEMENFMRGTFTVSFGNLYDNNRRNIKDCAIIQEITEEEYKVLKKFHIDVVSSGHFDFDDEDE